MNWEMLFFVGCMWIFLPIVYFTMRNNTVCKKNLILSVTLPPEAQKDEEVIAYVKKFKKQWLYTFLLLTAALVPSLFFRRFSVGFLWSMVWLIAAMFVIFRAYGKGYIGLKAIKRRRGWKTGTVQAAMETALLKLPKPVKTGWFVPPMILSILPVISVLFDELDPAWKLLLAINAFMCLGITAGSLLYHGLIFRQRPDVVDDNIDRTAALTRVRRYNWTKTWLLMAWLTGLYSVAAWIGQGKGYLAITLIYSAALLIVTLATEFAARRAQHRLSSDAAPAVDEDDYWIWGQFYYNPNDKKAFVNERVGMGMSMNYATPAGKAMAVFAVAVLLAMIPLGIWLLAEEANTTELTCSAEAIVAQHGSSTYEVPIDDIVDAELLEELPPSTRMWGTGMARLLKGKFSVEGYGAATFCLDPTDPPFLVLKTERETYIFSGSEVESIYNQIISIQ